MIGEMAEILKNELPAVILTQRKSHILVRPSIDFYHFHPSIFDGYQLLKNRTQTE